MDNASVSDWRRYLVTLAGIDLGRDILRSVGYGAVIEAPDKGDDRSTIVVARAALAEFARRYPELASITRPDWSAT